MEKLKKYSKIHKNYILKNKNIPVLSFQLEEIKKIGYSEYALKHINIINKELLPFNLKNPDKKNLEKWISHRKAPKNRKYMNLLLSHSVHKYKLDTSNIMNYIDISYGLSLNDSYWIVPLDDGNNYEWEKYNLYNNKFSEKLSLIAFGEGRIAESLNEKVTTSPEFTTNGVLAKCWTVLDDKIVLLKESSEALKTEAISEYYMSQVAKILDFDHVSYDIIEYKGHIVSCCELFTTENEGYSPIASFFSEKEVVMNNLEKQLLKLENILGEKFLQDIMVFDALIYNVDRHFGNFGVIVDNDTRTILRPAPIFDNGNSILMLYYNLPDGYEIYEKHRIGISFDVLASNYVQERHKEGLEKLKSFSFIRHPNYNLDDKILVKGENFIKKRAEKLLELLKEKTYEIQEEVQINKRNRSRSRCRSGNER